MNVWILHDSIYGNGKAVAERLAKSFSQQFQTTIADVKTTDPVTIANALPDMIIFGSAIRGFHNSDNMRNFFQKLSVNLEEKEQQVKFGAVFITHALGANKIRMWGKNALRTLQKSRSFQNVFPEYFSARVKEIQGPLYNGELEKFDVVAETLLNWMTMSKKSE